jgi:hypothetical protein
MVMVEPPDTTRPGGGVEPRRPSDGQRVDAEVPVVAAVLEVEHRLHQPLGDLVAAHRDAHHAATVAGHVHAHPMLIAIEHQRAHRRRQARRQRHRVGRGQRHQRQRGQP